MRTGKLIGEIAGGGRESHGACWECKCPPCLMAGVGLSERTAMKPKPSILSVIRVISPELAKATRTKSSSRVNCLHCNGTNK